MTFPGKNVCHVSLVYLLIKKKKIHELINHIFLVNLKQYTHAYVSIPLTIIEILSSIIKSNSVRLFLAKT